MKTPGAWTLAILAALVPIQSLPAEAAPPVSFRAEIAPLLHRRCAGCHDAENAKGGYRLDSFARLLRPGDSELPAVVPGRAGESELHRLLIEPDASDRMPQKADPLPAREIALIERWINEGAANDGGSPERPIVELARETMLRPAPHRYPRPVPVTALAFSPDGRQIAAAGYFEITLWNTDDGWLRRRIAGLPERITALAWHPKRNLIAVTGGTPGQWGTAALIDPAADFQTRYLCDLADTALTVAFSPDGERIAVGSADRAIRIFTSAGKLERVLRQHADWVEAVAFSADGKRLASASRDRTARVFSVANGELEATYTRHDSGVSAISFSPSGSTVLSAARGKSVHVWETVSGERKAELAFDSAPRQLRFLGPHLLMTTADHLVRLHQLSDRQPLLRFFGHRDFIESLAISPAGTHFASGSHDGEVCLWSPGCESPVRKFIVRP